MLAFEGYKKQFGDITIISIPKLELLPGVYWLKGENGSGKTTLFKSISGLIPFDGHISVAGQDIRADRIAYTSVVNYAEAEPLYPGFLTGADLIRFYSEVKKATDGQAHALAGALGITGYADNKTGTYSSGMTKKLSLVLGFLGMPKLIMLDEPLITLDQQSVQALYGLIQQYYATGVSFLITSHQDIFFDNLPTTRLLIKDKNLVVV